MKVLLITDGSTFLAGEVEGVGLLASVDVSREMVEDLPRTKPWKVFEPGVTTTTITLTTGQVIETREPVTFENVPPMVHLDAGFYARRHHP